MNTGNSSKYGWISHSVVIRKNGSQTIELYSKADKECWCNKRHQNKTHPDNSWFPCENQKEVWRILGVVFLQNWIISYTFRKNILLLDLMLQIVTLWDVGELHCGGIHGVARRSKWAMITTAVCLRSIASSLSCGKVRYLRKLSFGLRG